MKRRPPHLPFRAVALLFAAYGWLTSSGLAADTSPTATYMRKIQTQLLNIWCPPGAERSLLSLQLDSPGPSPFFTLPAEVNLRFVVRKTGGYRCEIRCAPSRE